MVIKGNNLAPPQKLIIVVVFVVFSTRCSVVALCFDKHAYKATFTAGSDLINQLPILLTQLRQLRQGQMFIQPQTHLSLR